MESRLKALCLVSCLALCSALAGPVGAAQDDALGTLADSPGCRQALEALNAHEAALGIGEPAASSGASGAAVESSAPTPSTTPAAAAASQPLTVDARRNALTRLEASKRQAASACLGVGQGAAAPRLQRFAQPPISVTPVTVPPLAAAPLTVPQPGIVPPASSTLTPSLTPPSPLAGPAIPPLRLPKVAPPTLVMACDAVSCWSSDGTRLQRADPFLLGPRGACTVVGALLQCP